MIRLILRDLFPSRSTVGALRQRVHELEHENKALGEAYARVNTYNRNLHAECDRLAAKILELERRAPHPEPTPAEARMLEIVRANPGLDGPSLGIKAWAPDDGKFHSCLEEPRLTKLYAANLTSLHRKSLVRREKSGNTYRYWVNE